MWLVLFASGGQASVEGDLECVECGLPSVGPALPAASGGVEADDGQVQHFQRCLFVREMAAGVDRAAEPGVERLDRVGGTDDRPDLDVEGEECDELRPGAGPQPDDRRVLGL